MDDDVQFIMLTEADFENAIEAINELGTEVLYKAPPSGPTS